LFCGSSPAAIPPGLATLSLPDVLPSAQRRPPARVLRKGRAAAGRQRGGDAAAPACGARCRSAPARRRLDSGTGRRQARGRPRAGRAAGAPGLRAPGAAGAGRPARRSGWNPGQGDGGGRGAASRPPARRPGRGTSPPREPPAGLPPFRRRAHFPLRDGDLRLVSCDRPPPAKRGPRQRARLARHLPELPPGPARRRALSGRPRRAQT
jgi:hypothetical protein